MFILIRVLDCFHNDFRLNVANIWYLVLYHSYWPATTANYIHFLLRLGSSGFYLWAVSGWRAGQGKRRGCGWWAAPRLQRFCGSWDQTRGVRNGPMLVCCQLCPVPVVLGGCYVARSRCTMWSWSWWDETLPNMCLKSPGLPGLSEISWVRERWQP